MAGAGSTGSLLFFAAAVAFVATSLFRRSWARAKSMPPGPPTLPSIGELFAPTTGRSLTPLAGNLHQLLTKKAFLQWAYLLLRVTRR